jgi:hypothetical protein
MALISSVPTTVPSRETYLYQSEPLLSALGRESPPRRERPRETLLWTFETFGADDDHFASIAITVHPVADARDVYGIPHFLRQDNLSRSRRYAVLGSRRNLRGHQAR